MHHLQEAPGIFRIPVRTPFRMQPTNAYVLKGDRVGLLDTGVNSPDVWDELRAGLRDLGLVPGDIDTVLISHAHVDHDGNAHRFPDAEVFIGERDHHKLVDFPGHMHSFAGIVADHMPAWGVPPAAMDLLMAPLRDLLGMSASVPWLSTFDGQTSLEGFGQPYRLLRLPGHTEGGIGLYREGDGVLLAGDHVLEKITPNPGLVAESDSLRSGLGDYVDSLTALQELDVSIVLPGHGSAFPGLRTRLETIREHHADRLLEVERRVGAGGSLFQVTAAMFPGIDSMNGFLALTEVFGHIQVLVESGRLEAHGDGGEVVVYRKTRP